MHTMPCRVLWRVSHGPHDVYYTHVMCAVPARQLLERGGRAVQCVSCGSLLGCGHGGLERQHSGRRACAVRAL
jgi:hypothetical protein